jgi:hypothetical protein
MPANRSFSVALLCTFTFAAGCARRDNAAVTSELDVASDAPTTTDAGSRAAPTFSSDIAPLLDRYCIRCHDRNAAEAGVVLATLRDPISEAGQRSLLRRMADKLRTAEMPPEGEPRPDDQELETLNSWLDTAIGGDDRASRRVSLRRLNRAEYNHTIRDLIGLDLHPADEFPTDDVGDGFDNSAEVLSTPPILLEMYLAAAETMIGEAFRSPEVRDRLMNPPRDTVPRAFRKYTPPARSARGDKTLRTAPVAADHELERQQHLYDILLYFCDRAFRRPARHDEITRLLALVVAAERDGEHPEVALQLALRAALVSPHFLFLTDPSTSDTGATTDSVPVNDFALASRISYFLWSSMPDDPLFRLAAQGSLRRKETLRAEVKRMLIDQKAQALADSFGTQWLQLRKLEKFTPDPALFPEFDESLRTAMLAETRLFFESIRDHDASVLEFLDADFTFVNERLARHYGISGVRGDQFRRISTAGLARGGLLTQASILAATSNPNRTSPVKRGKWILENILGMPPSPPPSGVEALKDRSDSAHPGTLREQMERHRSDPACAACHRKMDPLGFGLENFNVVGGWRTHEDDVPIDSRGQLPGGQTFDGPRALQAALGKYHCEFIRCLSEKMLTYALGRGLDRTDRRAVDQIVARVGREGYRFSVLVLAVVESEPFQALH